MSFSIASVLRITKDFLFPCKVFEKYEIDEIKNEEKQKLNLIEKRPAWTHKLLKCTVSNVINTKNVFYNYDLDEEKIIRLVPITELKEIQWLDLKEEAEKAFLKYNLKWYKRMINPREVGHIDHKDINPFVIDMINHIEKTGSKIEYIFRQDNKDKDIPQHVLALDMFFGIDLPAFSAKKAATILKRYILNNLNGIIPLAVASALCKAVKQKTSVEFERLLLYLPWALSRSEVMVLKELFRLFKIIDANVGLTKMSTDSLLNLFSLVLFPKEVFTDLDNVLLIKIIMDRIFLLDFTKVTSSIIPKVREIKKIKK